MGTFVTFYAYGAAGRAPHPNTIPTASLHGYTPWTIGSQLSSTPLRYMYKPSLDGGSKDAWSSTLAIWTCTTALARQPDGLLPEPGRLFHQQLQLLQLLPAGGMTGIGNDHAARIWYRALTTYFTSSMKYTGCRTACLSAATDLYGASSAEYAAVQNAFAAINVGTAPPE